MILSWFVSYIHTHVQYSFFKEKLQLNFLFKMFRYGIYVYALVFDTHRKRNAVNSLRIFLSAWTVNIYIVFYYNAMCRCSGCIIIIIIYCEKKSYASTKITTKIVFNAKLLFHVLSCVFRFLYFIIILCGCICGIKCFNGVVWIEKYFSRVFHKKLLVHFLSGELCEN